MGMGKLKGGNRRAGDREPWSSQRDAAARNQRQNGSFTASSISSPTRDTRLHRRPPARPTILKDYCLVFESWVPLARKHLFADVKSHSPADLELWRKVFPGQSNSPACHTHTLSVGCPEEVTTADAEQGGWIRSFSRVVWLVVHGNPVVSLTPFHGFSPAPKYLCILSNTLPNSQIFDLICSLPPSRGGINGIEDNIFNPDASSRTA